MIFYLEEQNQDWRLYIIVHYKHRIGISFYCVVTVKPVKTKELREYHEFSANQKMLNHKWANPFATLTFSYWAIYSSHLRYPVGYR